MFDYGITVSHSGLLLPWMIDCNSLTDSDLHTLARIVHDKFSYSKVIGIPRGGMRFAEALREFSVPNHSTLLVDDVLTTGKSMKNCRESISGPVLGVVIFARGRCPDWIWPLFTTTEESNVGVAKM